MAEQCADGLVGNFGEDLAPSFPDEDVDAIAAALGELQGEGLVELSRMINLKLPRVRTTVALFVACDGSRAASTALSAILSVPARSRHGRRLRRHRGER